jgi:hypothetical protein
MANNSKPGLGSNNMSAEDKHRIQSEGGKASAKSTQGAAGKTESAKRGGENSHNSGHKSE